jgi:hypothetical protein
MPRPWHPSKQARDLGGEQLGQLRWRLRRVERLSGQDVTADVGERDHRAPGPHVDGDDEPSARPHAEQRGATPTRCRRRALLEHHPALDQLAHERCHRAPVHLHPARELGARDRLILPDQVQDDAPVDLPGGRSGREPKVARVDLTHGQGLRSERERGERVVGWVDHLSWMRVAGGTIAGLGGKTAARPVDCT